MNDANLLKGGRRARDRALLIGVDLDQARIDGKTFAPNQASCEACFYDTLEHAAKNISLRGNARCGRARTPNGPGWHLRYRACRTSDRRGSPSPLCKSAAPTGSQRHTPRTASGSSVPDRSTGDPSMNNEVQVRCEDRTDRVSAKTKLVEKLTLVTLRTAHHRPRRDSHQHNGIMLRGLSQPIFATKAAPSRHASGC